MNAKDCIRLLIVYEGQARPIFWFSMGKDSSIFAGIRKTKINEIRIASKVVSGSAIRFEYNEGEVVASDEQNPSKISIHASGIVYTSIRPGFLFVQPALRELTGPQLLSVVAFEHPSKFEPVTSVRRRDVVLDYPISESSPLWMRMFATPGSSVQLTENEPNVVYRQTMLFRCLNRKPTATLISLQFDLCHGAHGPWPPYSCSIFRAEDQNIP